MRCWYCVLSCSVSFLLFFYPNVLSFRHLYAQHVYTVNDLVSIFRGAKGPFVTLAILVNYSYTYLAVISIHILTVYGISHVLMVYLLESKLNMQMIVCTDKYAINRQSVGTLLKRSLLYYMVKCTPKKIRKGGFIKEEQQLTPLFM